MPRSRSSIKPNEQNAQPFPVGERPPARGKRVLFGREASKASSKGCLRKEPNAFADGGEPFPCWFCEEMGGGPFGAASETLTLKTPQHLPLGGVFARKWLGLLLSPDFPISSSVVCSLARGKERGAGAFTEHQPAAGFRCFL